MFRTLLSTVTRIALEQVAKVLPQPRVIYDRAGGTPYLSRFYLKGRPRMADGSDPFDKTGTLKPEVIWNEGLGIYLHKFHRSDDDGALHNHPWKWALSIILAGGYSEERRFGMPGRYKVYRHEVKPFSLNYITSNDFHRVDLVEKDAWSIFITGPKFQGWGFWDRDTFDFIPWKEFIERRRKEDAEWLES